MASVPVGVAVNLALELLIQAQRVSTLVAAVHAGNRQYLNPDEIKALQDMRQDAFNKLDGSIARAEAEGR